MVGAVPDTTGLFVAAGHEGSGLTLAPMSARILASQVLRGPSRTTDASMDRLSRYLMPLATAHAA